MLRPPTGLVRLPALEIRARPRARPLPHPVIRVHQLLPTTLRRARALGVVEQVAQQDVAVRPGEVHHAVPLALGLLAGGAEDAVHGGVETVAAQFDEGVAQVYDGAFGAGDDVLPLWFSVWVYGLVVVRVEHLQAAEAVEEHGHGAEVRVLAERDGGGRDGRRVRDARLAAGGPVDAV